MEVLETDQAVSVDGGAAAHQASGEGSDGGDEEEGVLEFATSAEAAEMMEVIAAAKTLVRRSNKPATDHDDTAPSPQSPHPARVHSDNKTQYQRSCAVCRASHHGVSQCLDKGRDVQPGL